MSITGVCKSTNVRIWQILLDKIVLGDFPGGAVVKNPPSNAGDVGSIPGRGTKIQHAAGQLSPRAAATEPACHNERSHMPQ